MNEAKTADTADLRSGKGHRDENFPVASFLIHPRYRAPILAAPPTTSPTTQRSRPKRNSLCLIVSVAA
jgi:hypothetical protein